LSRNEAENSSGAMIKLCARTSAALAGVVSIVGLCALSGCSPKPKQPLPPSVQQQQGQTSPPLIAPDEHPKTVTIYTIAQNTKGDENDLVPITVPLAKAGQPARTALDALIEAKNSPLPKGTAVRSIKIEDGLATVDFSPQFKDNFHGSDTEEAQALNSILMTLGQFSTIQHVQILVNGAEIDTLGGHIETDSPLDVITPKSMQQARDNHDASQN